MLMTPSSGHHAFVWPGAPFEFLFDAQQTQLARHTPHRGKPEMPILCARFARSSRSGLGAALWAKLLVPMVCP
jgi:hypothetical protein